MGPTLITIDTSRVALALARTRLMAGRHPPNLLRDSREGAAKEAELTARAAPAGPFHNDSRQGFVLERVPHVTLKSIANNAEIDLIHEQWQPMLDAARAALRSTARSARRTRNGRCPARCRTPRRRPRARRTRSSGKRAANGSSRWTPPSRATPIPSSCTTVFVRHTYFLGGKDPYERLKGTLRAEIDADAWATPYSAESRPFPPPKSGHVAVKVINHYGDEALSLVLEVKGERDAADDAKHDTIQRMWERRRAIRRWAFLRLDGPYEIGRAIDDCTRRLND
jgi:hypothetical protein